MADVINAPLLFISSSLHVWRPSMPFLGDLISVQWKPSHFDGTVQTEMPASGAKKIAVKTFFPLDSTLTTVP